MRIGYNTECKDGVEQYILVGLDNGLVCYFLARQEKDTVKIDVSSIIKELTSQFAKIGLKIKQI
jgi:hypothetical protein